VKLGKAIYTETTQTIKDGKFVPIKEDYEVRIMAIAEGYAMVRRKGAMPFIARLQDLRQ